MKHKKEHWVRNWGSSDEQREGWGGGGWGMLLQNNAMFLKNPENRFYHKISRNLTIPVNDLRSKISAVLT